MASAKQIAWRKKFARMSKAGKFRKKKSSTKSNPHRKEKSKCEKNDAKFEKAHNMTKGEVRKNLIHGINEQISYLDAVGKKKFSIWLKNRKVEDLNCDELHDGWQQVGAIPNRIAKTDQFYRVR